MPRVGNLSANLLAGMQCTRQPVSFLFNGRGNYQPLAIFAPNSFATVRLNEFLSDRFVYVFITHDLKHHLTRNRRIPGLRLHLNTGWGGLRQHLMIPENVGAMDKVFLEGGIDIPDLVKLGIIQIGIGSFYRFGAYALDKTADNFAWKIVISLPF
jgi:hypothetical protein